MVNDLTNKQAIYSRIKNNEKNISVVQPEVEGPPVFEHTGNTFIRDAVERNYTGSITEDVVWKDSVILPKENTGCEINSYLDSRVVQPPQKPAEDEERFFDGPEKTNPDIIYAKDSVFDSSIPVPVTPEKSALRCSDFEIKNSSIEDSNKVRIAMFDGKNKDTSLNSTLKLGEQAEGYKLDYYVASRRFSRDNSEFWKDFCSASHRAVQTVADTVDSEENAAIEAAQKGKRLGANVVDALCAGGAYSVHEALLTRATKISEVASDAENLIKDGVISLSDLSSQNKNLKNTLKNAGIKTSSIKKIAKSREQVHNLLTTKQIFLGFATATGKLNENLTNFANSRDIFNTSLFSKEFTAITREYFGNSRNEILRKINPSSMSVKEVEKLLKHSDKYGLTPKDINILKTLKDHKLNEKSKRITSFAYGTKGHVRRIRKTTSRFVEKLGDDASAVGYKKVQATISGTRTAIAISKLVGKTSFKTAKIVGRVVFLNPLSRKIGSKISKTAKMVANTTATAIKNTKSAQAVTSTVNRVKNAAKKNKKVLRLKEKASKVKQRVTKVGNKIKKVTNKTRNVGRGIKKAGNKAARVVKAPFKVVLSPFSFVTKAFNTIKNILLKKLILPLAGIVLIIVIIYIILLAISGVAMSAIQKSKETVFLSNENMQKLVDHINTKAEAVYDKAYKDATGKPKTDKVYNNVKIRCYGSPRYAGDPTSEYYHHDVSIDKELLNGWHIYYLDSKGNVIGNNTSNTKDIVCLASVMMSNNTDDYSEYEDLINDMWEGMVPFVTMKESDIYHTVYSTDKFPLSGGYRCNDKSFYDKYEKNVKEGTCFYETPVEKQIKTPEVLGYHVSGSGCCYNEWYEWKFICRRSEHTHGSGCDTSGCPHICTDTCKENGCTHSCSTLCCGKSSHTHSAVGGSCYKKEWYREYFCPGHTALHCSYGYRDINIYVTLLSKDDYYKGVTTKEKTTMEYLAPTNFDGTSFEKKTATVKYRVHFDGYRRRMKEFFENKAWDYDNHWKFSYYDYNINGLTCDLPSINEDGSVHQGALESERCSGNIEWCNSLYRTDWYDTYGIRLYTESTGTTTTLSDAEIANYLTKINGHFGSISYKRKNFVTSALSNVGKIKYWYGGKPQHTGWHSEWGTVAIDDNPYYNINVECGRNILGLDSAGFVGWCYWNNYGRQPITSTKELISSLYLRKISYADILPGDIGLEHISGTETNHFGIFVGYDTKGKPLWVHCNTSNGTVSVNNINAFKYFYSVE